ncbi:MAG: hypothetical protein EPO32_06970 [Anaerolineae bacterium]|nr:MAG: hypothetical protein EPO32_06970 [Anaerolineae bacterium]
MLISIFAPPQIDPAYLDPGSGSFIIQLLVASFLGLGFAFRGFFARLFGRGKPTDDDEEEGDSTDGE